MRKRRIGLLGGTFDPPHIGHLVVAEQARDQLQLDEVRLLVAKDPWQKTAERPITPGPQRLAMARAAIEGFDGLGVSDVEFGRAGPTYTSDTIDHLAESEPGVDWVLIVGTDTAAGMLSWHDPERLAESCSLAVVNRLGTEGAVPTIFRYERVVIPGIEVSSTDIRARVASGRSVRFLVPEDVIAICEGQNLYRQAP